MRRPSALTIVLVSTLSAGCAQKTLGPTRFTPAYKAQLDPSDVATVRQCASVSGFDVTNALQGKVVGTRTLESSAVPPQKITAEGDLSGWVRSSAREMFRQASLKTTSAGAPRLNLKLSELHINENVHVNAGYDARVLIDASVQDAGGRECWTARKSGFAQNYGKFGSAEAYRETIDHALDRAIMAVAADSSFQDALCKACRK